MLIGDLVDTTMNLVAFAFIGAMVWLLLRPLAQPSKDSAEDDDRTEP